MINLFDGVNEFHVRLHEFAPGIEITAAEFSHGDGGGEPPVDFVVGGDWKKAQQRFERTCVNRLVSRRDGRAELTTGAFQACLRLAFPGAMKPHGRLEEAPLRKLVRSA